MLQEDFFHEKNFYHPPNYKNLSYDIHKTEVPSNKKSHVQTWYVITSP